MFINLTYISVDISQIRLGKESHISENDEKNSPHLIHRHESSIDVKQITIIIKEMGQIHKLCTIILM